MRKTTQAECKAFVLWRMDRAAFTPADDAAALDLATMLGQDLEQINRACTYILQNGLTIAAYCTAYRADPSGKLPSHDNPFLQQWDNRA